MLAQRLTKNAKKNKSNRNSTQTYGKAEIWKKRKHTTTITKYRLSRTQSFHFIDSLFYFIFFPLLSKRKCNEVIFFHLIFIRILLFLFVLPFFSSSFFIIILRGKTNIIITITQRLFKQTATQRKKKRRERMKLASNYVCWKN